jgi:tetratricopeptide (TPR) repeat protein
MAKLVVLRGDTVDRKIDLVQLPARIGRAPSNQVVLQDPMKGVSREHAEIRLVDGRYVLVDLGSENGIWVAGRRVPEVALEPNVIASIGPFRLMLAGEATVPDTEVVQQMPRPPVPVLPASKPAARQPAAPAPQTAPRPDGAAVNRRNWVVGGALAAAVVVGALVVVFWPSSEPEPTPITVSKPDVSARLADARRQVSEGLCAEAVQTIDLTLEDYPGHSELLSEKSRAQQECKPREDLGPPLPDVVAELRRAQGLLDSRDCRGALLVVNNVLVHEPENADASSLKRKVDQCLSPPPPPPGTSTSERLAQGDPPETGGLAVKPGELERDYRKRVAAMRARYDEALAALAAGVNPDVIALLEGILNETSPQYLDVAERLADARRQWARVRMKRALQLAAKDQWDEAILELKEAKGIDPTLPAEREIERIEKTKIDRGEQACQAGKDDFNYPATQKNAIRNFELALKLLPPSHPCYADAAKLLGRPIK